MGLKRKKTSDTDPKLDKSLQEARSLQLSALKNVMGFLENFVIEIAVIAANFITNISLLSQRGLHPNRICNFCKVYGWLKMHLGHL